MKKGEIYLINFEPALGAEIQKVRLGIIIQSETIDSKLITVMPISSKIELQKEYDIFLKKDNQNRLFCDSVIRTSQISSFDKKRCIHFIGSVDTKTLRKVDIYLRIHFDL
ncbi:type II toxin-antitoxin system PemK/MazF family toxin [Candidatus Peregrinibacteria bacterium]|nr:type II toxin-antitoxin system PemK/MazF family toxin [Candidatus Peregrinibacteria bacterium]